MKPSKQSVSELKRQLETEQADTNYDRVRQYRIGTTSYERPAFLSQQTKRKANEIGTLMHTVMQHLPFKEERLTAEEIGIFVDQLIVKAIIPKDAKADIQFDDIYKFVESDLYLTIAQSDYIYRELPFVVNQAKVDQLKDVETDASIIQGMIDLILLKISNITLLIIKQMHLIDACICQMKKLEINCVRVIKYKWNTIEIPYRPYLANLLKVIYTSLNLVSFQ